MITRQLPLFPTDSEHALTQHSLLAEAIGPFQERLRLEGRSPHTINAFTSDLRLLSEFFGPEMRLHEFTTTQLNRFMEWIEYGRGIPCSRKSYARRVTTLKVFFKFLREEKILVDNPATAVLQRSGAAPLQSALTEEEMQQVLTYTLALRVAEKPDARPDLLVRLLLDTAIKKSECMAITPDHIQRDNPDGPVLVVRYPKPNNVYKERRITLDPDWLEVLDEYLEQYRPTAEIFDCTARNLEYILDDIAQGAGIESRISFEILRWTSAVRDYRRGMDMDTLREKMGLSRISWRETSEKILRLAALQHTRR
ncbi:MAG TPA: site-specific integrase [Aggregatilineaceae bacterium]|nr:site-specific integrase [Aggregatilineaceae bacterium]